MSEKSTAKKSTDDKPKAKLMKMERDGKSADVHPQEVKNYQDGGWTLVN